MSGNSDESLINIINTLNVTRLTENTIEQINGTNSFADSSSGLSPKKVSCKMFSNANSANNGNANIFETTSFLSTHGLVDNTWAFNSTSDGNLNNGNNSNTFQTHLQQQQHLPNDVAVIGSMGNSDKSLSFNSDSNDSNDHGALQQSNNANNGGLIGQQQFRDNSQSPARYFCFNNSGSSNGSSPPLSQNSGNFSASSISDSGTSSTLKFISSMSTAATTNSSFGNKSNSGGDILLNGNNTSGGALLGASSNQIRPFNSFAQAVAAKTTNFGPVGAAGINTNSMTSTSGAFNVFNNTFQQASGAINKIVNSNNNNKNSNNNHINPLLWTSDMFTNIGNNIFNSFMNNSTTLQQQPQQQTQSQHTRRFSGQTCGAQQQNNNNNNTNRGLMHNSYSQDSLLQLLNNSNVTTPVTSCAINKNNYGSNFCEMNAISNTAASSSFSNNQRQQFFGNVTRNEMSNTNSINNSVSSSIMGAPRQHHIPQQHHQNHHQGSQQQSPFANNGNNNFLSNNNNGHNGNNNNGNNGNNGNNNATATQIQQAQSRLQAQLERQVQSLLEEINTTAQHQVSSICTRRELLLKQLEQIRIAHSVMLAQAVLAEDANQLVRLSMLDKTPFNQIRFNRPDQSSPMFRSMVSLGFLQSPVFGHYCQAAGEGLTFSIEGEPTCFMVAVKNVLNEEILTGGDRLDVEIVPLEVNGVVVAPSASAELAQLMSNISMNILDNNNGNYNVTYIIPRGMGITRVRLTININGLAVAHSPFEVVVRTERNNGESWKRVAVYGEEGSEPGRFCRPWGVAMAVLPLQVNPDHDLQSLNVSIPIHSKPYYNFGTKSSKSNLQEYLMAVADRSNNRIQLFKLSVPEPSKRDIFAPPGFGSKAPGNSNKNKEVEITVIHTFGSGPGTRPGQFDRPAGIAINTNLGYLVVADKDNHRIQVFDFAGNFQHKFGEKGSRAAQFCYPWDVAICPKTSMILVSDTRNRRIQLFTHYGQYLWHCGQPLDSPRGVAFLTPERFLVSDFNKHRLLIIDRNESSLSAHSDSTNSVLMPQRADDLNSLRYIGFGEGSAWGEFLRPQGLVANISHNYIGTKPLAMQILCADSRNNRISVWNSINQNFDYISEDTIKPDRFSPAPFDRPSGIAMAGNIMAVVDFGYNRLQIFQRIPSEH